MRGLFAPGSAATDTRLRPAVAEDDTGKSKSQRGKTDKHKVPPLSERSSSCRAEFLKLALLIAACCAVLTLTFSPSIHLEQPLLSGHRSRFADVARIWQKASSDPRYTSNLDVDWVKISRVLRDIIARGEEGKLKIGLLNFNASEARLWKQRLPHATISSVHLCYANPSLTWKALYPEWIDEEEKSGAPACPSLPQPKVHRGSRFDLVATKLPCDKSTSWGRSVARLHLQLAAAQVAIASGGGGARVHVLFVTDCFPAPNLFTCKDLVGGEGNLWLYKAELAALREKLRLPIGSCELAIPSEEKVRMYTEVGRRREAYATVLHSSEQYVCGAIALAQSIRSSGSIRELVLLADESVTDDDRAGLEAAGWQVRTIQRIRNPKAKRDAYNEWNYSKFRLWQLTDYDTVVFLDADLIVLRNIDFLFSLPEISAAGNNATLFNSGVMVIEPSNCTFQLLMDRIEEVKSYNGGDQGYLNEVFTWWHRVPRRMNFLKFSSAVAGAEAKEAKEAASSRRFGAAPPEIYAVHYLGVKPWLCYRDYDCNWNVRAYRGFASDAVHALWWRVHDLLPEELQRYCLLRTKVKAQLEYNRKRAEREKYADGHWKRNVTDPRLGICAEESCSWESMLAHWGEHNA